MAESSKDLRAMYALGAVLLLGVGAVVVVFASKGPTVSATPPAASASAPSASATSTSMVIVSDGAPNPVIPGPEPSVALSPSASGSVVIIDGKAYPVSSIQAGPEEKLTPAEELKRKKRAIEVLDEAITRTEEDLAKAQAAGDAKQIQTAKVRLERLRDVLAKRKAELGVPITDAG